MRENRPYGSEGGASQTNGTSLPLSLGRRSSNQGKEPCWSRPLSEFMAVIDLDAR